MTASIVGWAHTPFGKFDAETVESLVVKVATEALADAGISADDVDEIVLGHFNAGFSPQDFTASLVLQADPKLRFKPATRVENACATGSAAVHQGIRAIAAGRGQNRAGGRRRADDARRRARRSASTCCKASYLPEDGDTARRLCRRVRQDRAGLFPEIWRPVRCAGDDRGQEPQERRRQSLRADAQGFRLRVLPRREREEPVRRRSPEAHRLLAGVGRRGGAGADGYRDRQDHGQGGQLPRHRACAGFPADVQARHPAVRRLHRRLAARAGAGRRQLSDLSFVETHDCFTVAELIEYEAMGLTPRGQGARAIKEGWTQKDGKLPVNPSGGLKAKGHPIGATGVSMHVMSAMQLVGQAPEGMQLKNPKLAGIFNMGGAAVANYVSVLEPAK